jgi:hypothetical protein
MRLRYCQEWYLPISSNALLEREYEDILEQNSEVFAENCWVIPFRPTVYATGSSAKPDFAIIEKSYARWFVVEVEMGRHSLHGHVLPQVRTLRDATYGREHAEMLVSRQPELDLEKTSDLLRGTSPTILVLADRYSLDWERTLEGAGISLMSLELFRSERLRYVLAVNGGLPQRASDLITHATFNPLLPRFLAIESPAALPIANRDRIEALWEERLTVWVRSDIENECFLRASQPLRLRAGVRYSLVRRADGTLIWKSRALKEFEL